jgi:hypothetical protein
VRASAFADKRLRAHKNITVPKERRAIPEATIGKSQGLKPDWNEKAKAMGRRLKKE